MRKILVVALTDLRVTLQDPSTLIFLMLIPAFLVIAVAFANGAFAPTTAEAPAILVDVIDSDGSALSQELVTLLRTQAPDIVLCPLPNDTADVCRAQASLIVDDRISQGISTASLEIPAGFGAALLSAQPIALIYTTSDADGTLQTSASRAIQAVTLRLSGAAAARQLSVALGQADPDAAYQRAGEIWASNPVSVAYVELTDAQDAVELARQQPGFRQSVPGMGSMYVMFTVLAGISIFLTERRNWTLQRLLTMPVTGGQIIMGKMLARFAMGMIQYAVAFVVGLVFAGILGFSFGTQPLTLIAVAAAFTLCICALTLLLATVVETEQQANGLTTLIALTLAPIGGAWWSLEAEFIPDFMRQISYLSPIRYVMDGFRGAIFDNATVLDVLPQLGVLLAIAAVLFAVAVRRFKFT
ncbi:MAG: ABC transporter permease [Armatimonadetes bacterium]|nr:ABC transporter permease [Anaerolineae bacterium]